MKFLTSVINELFGQEKGTSSSFSSIAGGCINHAGKFEYEGVSYFLKWNTNAGDLFEKEQKGLELIANTNTISVPRVIGRGNAENICYLCLQFISSGNASRKYWANLGESLAKLHQIKSHQFGLDHDNYIGKLPQSNAQTDDWATFFAENRLLPQIKMSKESGLIDQKIERRFESIICKIDHLLPAASPVLTHGDLWSGNVLCGPDDVPFVFDPAAYYGHREAEIAFTRMFGGFDSLFYLVYQECLPLAPGFDERVDIYNLYPLMVHVNLFGNSYLPPVIRTLKRFA